MHSGVPYSFDLFSAPAEHRTSSQINRANQFAIQATPDLFLSDAEIKRNSLGLYFHSLLVGPPPRGEREGDAVQKIEEILSIQYFNIGTPLLSLSHISLPTPYFQYFDVLNLLQR